MQESRKLGIRKGPVLHPPVQTSYHQLNSHTSNHHADIPQHPWSRPEARRQYNQTSELSGPAQFYPAARMNYDGMDREFSDTSHFDSESRETFSTRRERNPHGRINPIRAIRKGAEERESTRGLVRHGQTHDVPLGIGQYGQLRAKDSRDIGDRYKPVAVPREEATSSSPQQPFNAMPIYSVPHKKRPPKPHDYNSRPLDLEPRAIPHGAAGHSRDCNGYMDTEFIDSRGVQRIPNQRRYPETNMFQRDPATIDIYQREHPDNNLYPRPNGERSQQNQFNGMENGEAPRQLREYPDNRPNTTPERPGNNQGKGTKNGVEIFSMLL